MQILDGITPGRCPANAGRKRGLRTRRFVVVVFTASYVADSSSAVQFLEAHMTVKPIIHEIRIQNQVIFLDPPIEYARQTWVRQLHDWIGEIEEYESRRDGGPNYAFRCCLSITSNPEFEVRDWVTDAERYCVGNDVHFIGAVVVPCWSILSWTDALFYLAYSSRGFRIIPSNTRSR